MKNLNFVSRTDKSQQLFLPFLFDIHFLGGPFAWNSGGLPASQEIFECSTPRTLTISDTGHLFFFASNRTKAKKYT